MIQIPDLQKTDYDTFDGEITLMTWKGFQVKMELFKYKNSVKMPEGMYEISIKAEEDQSEPSEAQLNAYEYLVTHQEQIRDSILLSLLKEYNDDIYDAYEGIDEEEKPLPIINQMLDFKSIIELVKVHILDVEKQGTAYIGFQFSCSWDSEHALGAMTYMDRVVKIGGADISFLEWVARRDI